MTIDCVPAHCCEVSQPQKSHLYSTVSRTAFDSLLSHTGHKPLLYLKSEDILIGILIIFSDEYPSLNS